MNHRPDIDGLRAVAVLSVLAYHYGALLPGGFVGVDVFFVISGYLITWKIVQALQAGKFTFREFYTRRARRILPALFATLIASFAAAVVLQTPEQLQLFAASLLASVLSVSNLYFQMTAGYFDAASASKPLLHIWSLSVEEQFYLVWPLALFIAFRMSRKWGLVTLIVAAGVLSFALNLSFQDGHSSLVVWWSRARHDFANGAISIFYFTPFRAFEFAIGALVVWLAPVDPKRPLVNDSLLLAGLGLIGYSALTYSDKLLYPSTNALMPCLGAALAIYAGSARYAGLILKNPAAVRIGLVSYSLYLVHWPVIVFGQLWLYHPLSPFELAIAVVVSYATAELMYHYIEQPFRTGPAAQRFLPYGAMGAAAMLLVSVLAYTAKVDDGWSWRLPDDLRQVATENRRTSPEIVGSIGCQASCDFGNPGAPTILLVGDSHIDQYTKTLNRMAGDKYHFHLAYSPSCFFGATMISHPTPDLSPLCEQANAALHEWLKTNRPQAIIAAERWPGYRSILYKNGQTLKIDDPTALYSLMLHDIAALYAGFTGPVIVLAHTPSTTAQCFLKPRLAALRCPKVVPIEDDEVRAAFAAFRPTTTLNMTLVSPDEALCPNRLCNIRDGRGHPLYSDIVHVSVYGAALIVPKILSALREASPRPPGVALGQQGSYPR